MSGNVTTFASIVHGFVGIINLIIPILASVALVLFFWGLVQYLYRSGDSHSKQDGKALIGWGLLSLFVLFSLWGILTVLNQSIFGGVQHSSGATAGYGGSYGTGNKAENY